ncbi:MAG TPA: HD domain-containing protein [Candidatus Limnocylindrales bacterium]
MAETAGWLAWRAASAGRSVDRHLVEAAALLHDIDKLARVKAEVTGVAHAEGSSAWLTEHGYPELGPVISGHPVTRLADESWFEGWISAATPEDIIVSYSDKRAGQRLETMAERFASWERRYPPEGLEQRGRGVWSSETLAAVRLRAEEIEQRACALAGIAPDDVRRLRWTSAALSAARLGRATVGAVAGHS